MLGGFPLLWQRRFFLVFVVSSSRAGRRASSENILLLRGTRPYSSPFNSKPVKVSRHDLPDAEDLLREGLFMRECFP